jgi:hypothetical protein
MIGRATDACVAVGKADCLEHATITSQAKTPTNANRRTRESILLVDLHLHEERKVYSMDTRK